MWECPPWKKSQLLGNCPSSWFCTLLQMSVAQILVWGMECPENTPASDQVKRVTIAFKFLALREQKEWCSFSFTKHQWVMKKMTKQEASCDVHNGTTQAVEDWSQKKSVKCICPGHPIVSFHCSLFVQETHALSRCAECVQQRMLSVPREKCSLEFRPEFQLPSSASLIKWQESLCVLTDDLFQWDSLQSLIMPSWIELVFAWAKAFFIFTQNHGEVHNRCCATAVCIPHICWACSCNKCLDKCKTQIHTQVLHLHMIVWSAFFDESQGDQVEKQCDRQRAILHICDSAWVANAKSISTLNLTSNSVKQVMHDWNEDMCHFFCTCSLWKICFQVTFCSCKNKWSIINFEVTRRQFQKIKVNLVRSLSHVCINDKEVPHCCSKNSSTDNWPIWMQRHFCALIFPCFWHVHPIIFVCLWSPSHHILFSNRMHLFPMNLQHVSHHLLSLDHQLSSSFHKTCQNLVFWSSDTVSSLCSLMLFGCTVWSVFCFSLHKWHILFLHSHSSVDAVQLQFFATSACQHCTFGHNLAPSTRTMWNCKCHFPEIEFLHQRESHKKSVVTIETTLEHDLVERTRTLHNFGQQCQWHCFHQCFLGNGFGGCSNKDQTDKMKSGKKTLTM